MFPSLSLLALLAAAPAPGAASQDSSMSIRALLDKGHPRAPDLDRVGTWLGTDRPLLLRGALKGRVVLLDFWTSGCVNCLHAFPVLRASAAGWIVPSALCPLPATVSTWPVARSTRRTAWFPGSAT